MSEYRPTLEEMWFSLDVSAELFRFARGVTPLRYEHVQALLDSLDCAITLAELFVVSEGVFAFVLKPGDREPRFLEWSCSSEQLEYLLSTYHRELVQYPQYGTDQRWQQIARPLLELLLPSLEGSDVVYLIPHDGLSYLPLHALRVNGDYLIDQFPIVYAQSAELFYKNLHSMDKAVGTPRVETALIAGNPTFDLQHAEEEVEWVANYFRVRPYLGREATKVRIRSQLADKDLIHLACHGFFHSFEPLQSGLLMAGKRTLNVQDIKATKIRADLITLSACESALTSIRTNGISKARGLRLAFLEAGAKSVLGSLWPVADAATTLLVSQFYSALYDSRGEKINTKAKALQQAMLAVRARKEHPYYWAGFTLSGSWR
jgi:CHAT domain-containing protein